MRREIFTEGPTARRAIARSAELAVQCLNFRLPPAADGHRACCTHSLRELISPIRSMCRWTLPAICTELLFMATRTTPIAEPTDAGEFLNSHPLPAGQARKPSSTRSQQVTEATPMRLQ